ncbi:heavy metal sensor histidine kinase [Xylophilus sp. ASV27]|uniref:heavy metal sensor histidine kinase n=1 Tax=Xylophilus sp. ASV27 TaxID=2795129 RepID=UPI0018EC30B1|nr:heavy metal sensor histidine kinase [Xylophilus sp. ASV27]
MARNSIALRLALMFAVAAFAALALIGLVLHQVLGHELRRHQREEIGGQFEGLQYMLVHSRSPQLAAHVRERLDSLASSRDTHFWLWSEDPAFRYGDAPAGVADATRGAAGIVSLRTGSGAEQQTLHVLGRVLPANEVRPAVQLMVGIDARPFNRTLRAFETALLLVTVAGTLLVAALGYWIARLGLRPVARLSADAQRIGPDRRGQRLDLPRLPRELADLGASLNAAFDRLDAAYRQLETFNADVAHELRTPLGTLIGQTQVALAREREAGQLRGVLQSNLEELERLRAIVADMLFLARAEQGERARMLVAASIAQEVGKTVEFLDLLLDDAGVAVRVSGDLVAPIETSLFRRALSNLLHNAIQHSRPGAAIEVRITQQQGAAVVAFSNASAPIAPAQLERLFDRFYRVDAARANSHESHGLGLAIVKAVAAMHGGTVFARSEGGLTTVGFSVALDSAPA